jgi:ribosome-associated heat shock protein Hsp15
MTEPDQIRIDKWLWCVRFFKTRSLATDAVNGGRVHLNGQRVKAGRAIRAGDQLTIQKNNEVFEVEVTAIIKTRRPAKEAVQCYRESEQSQQRREQERDIRKIAAATRPVPRGRPDKRDRQRLRDFKIKA